MLSISWKKKKKTKKVSKHRINRGSQSYRFLYPLYGLGCVAAFAIVVAGYVYLEHMLNASQAWALNQTQQLGFSLNDVVVVGRKRTSEAEVMAAVGLKRDAPLYTFDPHSAKEQLEECPWVEEAFVQRRPPHSIFIHVQESIPVALWQYKGKHQLIDSHGKIIHGQDPRNFRHMIKVIGKDAANDAPRIIKALENYPELRQRITSLTHQHGRRWDMRIEDRIDVKLPEDQLDLALTKLDQLEGDHDVSRGEIMTIDMRIPDKLILRLTPEATQRLKASGRDA